VSALERGRLPIVGRGDNVTDLTYVDNVVDAMLLAAEAPEALVGRKYNVTNGEPVLLWEMVGRVCDELGLERPTRRISYPLVLAAAVALEGVHRVLMPDVEPLLTRYTAGVLAKSTTLDITAARRDLGYKPRVSVGEGLSRFVAWWKQRPR
jgi:nucleoside-diphosphate-sugar epimerase